MQGCKLARADHPLALAPVAKKFRRLLELTARRPTLTAVLHSDSTHTLIPCRQS